MRIQGWLLMVILVSSGLAPVGGAAGDAVVTYRVAELPATLAYASSAAAGGKVYIFGGVHGHHTILQDILVFDPATNAISLAGARLPTPRMMTVAVPVDDRIYIFGGADESGLARREIVEFDTRSGKAAKLSVRLPYELEQPLAGYDGEEILVFSGSSTNRPAVGIIAFHPETKSIRAIPGPKISERFQTASAASDGRTVFAFGGVNDERGIFIVDKVNGSLRRTNATLPFPHEDADAVWDGHRIWLWGGRGSDVARFDPATEVVEEPNIGMEVVSGATSVWLGKYGYQIGGNGYDRAPQSKTIMRINPNEPRPPVASFTVSTDGMAVFVDAAESVDPDGTIKKLEWEWADPAGSTRILGPRSAIHHYSSGGPRVIRLILTDDDGLVSTTEVTVDLQNGAPIALYKISVNGGDLLVDANPSIDPDGDPLTFRWTWGDGTLDSEAPKGRHRYAKPGIYLVELRVADDEGLEDIVASFVNVTDVTDRPRGDLGGDQRGGESSANPYAHTPLEVFIDITELSGARRVYATAVRDALSFWETGGNGAIDWRVDFIETPSRERADIVVEFMDWDGMVCAGVVAIGCARAGSPVRSGSVWLAMRDTDGGFWSERNMRHIAKHEVGHTLGLGHSQDPADIMFGQANFELATLTTLPSADPAAADPGRGTRNSSAGTNAPRPPQDQTDGASGDDHAGSPGQTSPARGTNLGSSTGNSPGPLGERDPPSRSQGQGGVPPREDDGRAPGQSNAVPGAAVIAALLAACAAALSGGRGRT